MINVTIDGRRIAVEEGTTVLGADLAVRAVAAGRIAAASIHQYLTGEPVTEEPVSAAIAMRPVDDDERAAMFRSIERAPRVRLPELAMERRRFAEDTSHPEIVYKPGKCINCDACVRIAAAAGEKLAMTMIGRGFDVRVALPFGKPLSEALTKTARRCAGSCPTGALALRTERSCLWKCNRTHEFFTVIAPTR